MIELEHHEVVLRYRSLRVRNRNRESHLRASLALHGQKGPVLVVRAVALESDETTALVLQHRLENSRERSALEGAWLVRHLVRVGLSREEVAEAL